MGKYSEFVIGICDLLAKDHIKKTPKDLFELDFFSVLDADFAEKEYVYSDELRTKINLLKRPFANHQLRFTEEQKKLHKMLEDINSNIKECDNPADLEKLQTVRGFVETVSSLNNQTNAVIASLDKHKPKDFNELKALRETLKRRFARIKLETTLTDLSIKIQHFSAKLEEDNIDLTATAAALPTVTPKSSPPEKMATNSEVAASATGDKIRTKFYRKLNPEFLNQQKK